MNLARLASERGRDGRPVRAGLIGAGKFGTMFLAQVPHIDGLDVTAIADLDPERTRRALSETGWDTAAIERTTLLDSGADVVARDDVDVVIEATGNAVAGVDHALAAIAAGRHVVMVNVEADVLAGPALAVRAAAAGVVYSMAYGDQPALVAEMVDWARATGFRVAAAGKGTRYLPAYHKVTPAEVWTHYGITPQAAAAAGMNPKMFNSFLDGTKSAIEMAAIANACALDVPSGGLAFPPCGVDDLAHLMRPRAEGGVLEARGIAEVVSSLERDGRPVFRDLRWGVYVILEAPTPYAASCFGQYGLQTDASGRFAAMFKPYHLIGLELSVSVLSAALRGEPTGRAEACRAGVVCVAKRDLAEGEVLDGEGGYMVWGRARPAADAAAGLPMGLADGARLTRPVRAGDEIALDAVETAPSAARDLWRECIAAAAEAGGRTCSG
ncbi:MAG: Gfo/Idh/MocA family oxidoreductase [Pseudomonadota bacterium]